MERTNIDAGVDVLYRSASSEDDHAVQLLNTLKKIIFKKMIDKYYHLNIRS